MNFPTIASDFVAAASTCQEPVKLNMALKLPSGMCPDIPDFSLKYPAIWNFKHQWPLLEILISEYDKKSTKSRIIHCNQENSSQTFDIDEIF